MSAVISLSSPTTPGSIPIQSSVETSSASTDTGPGIQLSFPAVVRNPGLTSRFAHLLSDRDDTRRAPAISSKKFLRCDDNEGKRWVRRKENARFSGNPHITAPSKRDLEPTHPVAQTTFPVPLPSYLPRIVPLLGVDLPMINAQAASAGRFGLSLRGMRKVLRRTGPRTQALVRGVEEELVRWLQEVQVVTSPDDENAVYNFPGCYVGGQEGVREVLRTPARLVWWIEDDAWARYVVHCCARYHDVVSFSKDTSTLRLTHILRPNVTRPDPITLAALATPPTTDVDLSSLSSYDSDLVSSLSDVPSDTLSDILSEGDLLPTSALSDIASEAEVDIESGSVGSLYRTAVNEADAWSADADSLASGEEDTPRPRRGAAYRAHMWDRARSGSSPSRSPARRLPRRRSDAVGVLTKTEASKRGSKSGKSFYEYLFS